VADVAGNIIRKLIPPAQRFHLKAIDREQALEFKLPPQGAIDLNPKDELLSIRDLLHRVPVVFVGPSSGLPGARLAIEPATLHGFLLAKGQTQGPFYRALDFLALPVRQLVDFWQLLEAATLHTTESESGSEVSALASLSQRVQDFCRDSIWAEQGLSAEMRGALMAFFASGADGSSRSRRAMMDLVVANPVAETLPLYDHISTPTPPLSWTVRFGSETTWNLRIEWPVQTVDPSIPSTGLQHLLAFATDLATLARSDGTRNPLLEPRIRVSRLAGIGYRFGDVRVPWLAWPLPPLLMIWEVDRFLDEWSYIIRPLLGGFGAGIAPDFVPKLVFLWIRLGVKLLSVDSKGTPLEKVITAANPILTSEDWEGLRVSTEKLLDRNRAYVNGQPISRWIADVLSLLNPEVHDGDDTVRLIFARSTLLSGYCRGQSQRFAQRRAGYLKRSLQRNDVVEAFLAACRLEPAWWEEFYSRRPPFAGAPTTQAATSDTTKPAPTSSSTTQAATGDPARQPSQSARAPEPAPKAATSEESPGAFAPESASSAPAPGSPSDSTGSRPKRTRPKPKRR
jgi:hypothetical protein